MEKSKKAVLLFSWAAKVAFNLTGGSFYSEDIKKTQMQSNTAKLTKKLCILQEGNHIIRSRESLTFFRHCGIEGRQIPKRSNVQEWAAQHQPLTTISSALLQQEMK